MNERPVICWVGKAPQQLHAELARRRLQLVEILVSDLAEYAKSDARALLIPLTAQRDDDPAARLLASKYLQHMSNALNRGIGMFFVPLTISAFAIATEVIATKKRARDASSLHRGAWVFNPNASHPWDIAQRCAEYNPQRSLIPNRPKLPPQYSLDSDEIILIARAFNDFDEIQLSKMDTPANRAAVWCVRARKSNAEYAPYAVKIDSFHKIDDEIEQHNQHYLDLVPFAHRPPMLEDRCVLGMSKRAMVTMFVDNARHIGDTKALSISAINALFEGPLSIWRRAAERVTISLPEQYQKDRVFPHEAKELNVAYSRVPEGSGVLPPDELLRLLNDIPPMSFNICFGHGDMHYRNVFVGPKNGIVLIDYYRADRLPAARDPATLEVSLAFDDIEGRKPLSEAKLRAIFKPPLLNKPHLQGDDRLAAICQLRKQAAALCAEPEYRLSVACLLLWQAWRRENALAYELASKIIEGFKK